MIPTMPAVQAPSFGASERFFVSPGHLEDAILTLPGGQSATHCQNFLQLALTTTQYTQLLLCCPASRYTAEHFTKKRLNDTCNHFRLKSVSLTAF